jgi:hypothetical protein
LRTRNKLSAYLRLLFLPGGAFRLVAYSLDFHMPTSSPRPSIQYENPCDLPPQRQCMRAATFGMAMGLSALLAACGPGAAPPAGPPGGMPLAEVGVVTVAPGDIGLFTELPADWRPRVSPRSARAPPASFRSNCSVKAAK